MHGFKAFFDVKKQNQPRLLGSVERQMDNGICEVAAAVEPLKPFILPKSWTNFMRDRSEHQLTEPFDHHKVT